MPGLLFNNIWMLAGMAALAVPVIIHLLLRRKKKRLRFSTVQFFVRQDEQSSQRRKLRNWLLLAMRLLICALLVLAFARPYFQSGAAANAAQRKQQVIVVLDRSLSMQAGAVDGPKWPRAREAVRQILSQLKPDDRAALITCSGHAEVLSEWAPAITVTKLLDDIQPGCAAANVSDGLQQAMRLLSFRDPKAAATIYVVSDLQRSSCQNLAAYPVPTDVQVRTVKVGDLVTPNLAMVDLQLDPKEGAKPHAVLASFSDEDTPEARIECKVDGQLVSARSLALSAGASSNIDLALPALKPGWHEVVVQLRGHDPLPLDDARYQSVFVPEPTRACVVESRRASRVFEEESFFITTALNPTQGSSNVLQSSFACEKVSPEELASRLSSKPGVPVPDLVVLPGLKQIPAALGFALKSYLQAGGGLLLFLGDGVSAIRYNAEFREILPAALGNLEAVPETELGWRIGEYNTNSPLFAAFSTPNSGNLSLAHFPRRFSIPQAEAALVVARFEDGVPFILASKQSGGRVVLVNSSADTAWNDWPKHKTFVPWLHGTGQYLASRKGQEQTRGSDNWIAGSDVDFDLGSGAAKGTFKLQPPTGKEVALTADDQGQLRDVPIPTPGIYSLRDLRGAEVRRFAVNVPVQECDLAALSANDFERELARAPDARQTTLAAGLFGPTSNQREMWRVLLLMVVGLLFLELLVANRTLA